MIQFVGRGIFRERFRVDEVGKWGEDIFVSPSIHLGNPQRIFLSKNKSKNTCLLGETMAKIRLEKNVIIISYLK